MVSSFLLQNKQSGLVLVHFFLRLDLGGVMCLVIFHKLLLALGMIVFHRIFFLFGLDVDASLAESRFDAMW